MFDGIKPLYDACMTLHWLALVMAMMSCTILSKYVFATRPISLFDGLISLHDKLRVKLSLWSFSVMKAFLSAYCSIRLHS